MEKKRIEKRRSCLVSAEVDDDDCGGSRDFIGCMKFSDEWLVKISGYGLVVSKLARGG